MATMVAANPDMFLARKWSRLWLALALSLLLHIALLLGVPVNPTGGVPLVTSIISARLESTVDAQPAVSAAEPQAPDAALEVKSAKPSSVDPLADPADKKLELKSELPAAAPPAAAPSAGIEIPLIRDSTYYPATQLDVYPQPLAPIQLAYPESAALERIEGNLLMLLLIDEFGIVADVSVIEATPAGYFEEAARAVFRITRFSPGMRHGHAVKSRMPFRVRYTYDKSAEPNR